jgi:uncharacterized protein
MATRGLTLTRLPGRYAVARLEPEAEVPPWARSKTFACVTRTRAELSSVCSEAEVPSGVPAQRGFCGLQVKGPLDFSETGILASLAGPLAMAGISIFAVSTYDTDYLFVPAAQEPEAIQVLIGAGHTVHPAPEA